MKKLFLSLIAVVLFSGYSFGQNLSDKKEFSHLKVETVSKLYGIISYLETKDFYKPGMTEKQFVEGIMAYQFDNGNRPEFFMKYLSYIYKFHTSKMDYNQVYDAIDTQHFVDFGNEALKYRKKGMTKEDVLLAIYNNGNQNINPRIQKPKHGWLNLVRKLIDIIDDEF